MFPKFLIIDTFSDKAFCGAPVAVVFVDSFEQTDMFANIASEINIAETAFVKHNNNNNYEILCYCHDVCAMPFGSAIFAAAYAICNMYNMTCSDFNIVHGCHLYKATVNNGLVSVQFQKNDVKRLPIPGILSSIFNEIIVSVADVNGILLVELRSPSKILSLDPNINVIAKMDTDIIAVTSDTHHEENFDYDYCVRIFAPKMQVNESYASPIVDVALFCYWKNKQLIENSATSLNASSRPIYTNIKEENDYVIIDGKCVLTMQGELNI